MTFKVKDGLSVGANVILDSSGNLTVPGKTTLSNTTTTGASLNLGTGTADPTTPATGDVWNNTGVLKIRQAAATKTVAYTDSTITGNAANVTGTVAIANGGTNGTATPTAGAVPYGTGTAFAFTAPGTAGQILTSNAAGAPTWQTLSSTSTNATFVAITDDVATATSQYLYFGSATSGNTGVKSSSSRLTFVPSTGNLSTIGSVAVGGNGVILSGSSSGTTTLKASATAGTTTITLPATTGNVVTTGDTGTVTSTMIADGTITNTDINASAAIAITKLAASTISGVALGGTLSALTISTGLTGTSYNGSSAISIALATSGVTAAVYGSATNIPAITVDTYGRITSATNTAISIGAGTLGASTVTAGATNTTVALNFSGAYNANSTTGVTINPVVGPAITALSAVMTGATTGVLSKSAADTYSLVTNISTATTLQTARNIQGVSFNGSADITVVTAGTGVGVSGTAVSIGQAVATSSDVRFNSIGVGVAASGTAGTVTGTQFTGNAATVTNGVYTGGAQTIDGAKTFSSLTGITISSAAPAINFFETGQTLPAGRVKLVYDNNSLQLQRNTAALGDFSTIVTDMSVSSAGAVTATSFNGITGLSSTAPVIAGTATIGSLTTAAKADHVHPVQTSVSGNAANVTGTVAIANGGTGSTTVAGALAALGGTTVGINFFDLPNPTAITFPKINADNTVSALDAATFRSAIGASSTVGTVTSIAASTTPVSGLSLSGGTITTSGTIGITGTLAVTAANFASQTANTFLAAPNGAGGAPTFRAIVAADIPTLNQSTSGNAGSVTNGVYTTGDQSIDGAKTFSSSLTVRSSEPQIKFFDVGFGGTDQGRARIVYDSTTFLFQRNTAVAGDFSTFATDLSLNSSGLLSVAAVSGNAGTATTLQTARNINGVSFNGSADITVADSTKLPLAGGTMTGNLYINTTTPTVYLQDTDNMPAFLHCNSNNFYVLRHATANSTTWDSGPNGRHPMTLSLSSGDVTFSGNVTAYSDERLKKNIVPIANSLDKVSALTGVMFERLEGQKGTGLVAQNVQAVIPEAVSEDADGYLSVSYGNLVGLLVEAIKELKQEIETLKSK